MDSEIIKSFLSEAESYLPVIREALSAYQISTSETEAINTAYRHIHTIKGAAMMISLPQISENAKEIEDELEILDTEKCPLESEKAEILFQKLTVLEALILEAISNCDSPDNTQNHETESSQDFFEELDNTSDAETSSNQGELETFDEDFELDDEMLEIFGIEAEDHLRNIASQLELLENEPNNHEALMEIRRSSHTLKGAAGICGFKKISDLSHRMEDLLDLLAEQKLEGNSEIFNILLASTDYLERFAHGDNSSELNENVEKIYLQFDQVLEVLTAKPQEIVSVSETVRPTETLDISHFDENQNDLFEVVAELPEEVEPLEAEYSSRKPERSVVRVSLERLDELVKLTGEMVLSRSIFEQRIAELEAQIRELQLTTGRLKSSTTRLETDFEAKSLSSSPLIFSSFSSTESGFSHAGFPSNSFEEFDALEFDQYTDFHQTTRQLIETATDASSIGSELESLLGNLETVFSGQRRLVDEMQEKLHRLRMVPLSSFVSRLQRTVRVTASQEEKLADFVLEGENLEIDTQIVDILAEPLLHLLRNAVGHGIESPETRRMLGKNERGLIQMRAYCEGTNLVFKISDDGKGISPAQIKQKAIEAKLITRNVANELNDEEILNLIFIAGFSTAETISQVSGRGVGMEIVKSIILRRKGEISVESEVGKGSTFTISIPMALSVTRSMLIKSNGQKYAFPLNLVKQVVEVSSKELDKAKEKGGLRLGNTNYSIFFLNELLGFPEVGSFKDTKFPILLIETPGKSCALVVDQILKPQELVIKKLDKPLDKVRELIGATVLGDGSVLPILDLIYLLKRKFGKVKKVKIATPSLKTQFTVMIVDDSPSVRRVNSNLITNNGWQAIVAKDGLEAIEIIQKLNTLPSIILTDVEMPRMDGYELLASLKRQTAFAEIPVVMITSRAGDKHKQKAYELGVSDYLTKPYDDSKLIDIVKSLTNISE